MSTPAPRIALIHATPVAMEPIHQAFGRLWPQASLMNLLDDSLSADRAASSALSEVLCERFVDLVSYAVKAGAQGVLVTCSAFGPAIQAAARQVSVPVLKPNEAMFRAALEYGDQITMLATFKPALLTMQAEFAEQPKPAGSKAQLQSCLVLGAMDSLRAGNAEHHNQLVAEHASTLAPCDAIMLAHFSTSRAAEHVRARVNVPVLCAPDSAVLQLRAMIEQR